MTIRKEENNKICPGCGQIFEKEDRQFSRRKISWEKGKHGMNEVITYYFIHATCADEMII